MATQAKGSGYQEVAICEAIEPLEEKQAKERQAKAGPSEGKGKKSGGGKLPQAVKGKSRDKVAKYVGKSAKTMKKAKGVAAQLVKILSASESKVFEWLSRIDKDSKVKRNNRMFAAWLACATEDEIAEREGVNRDTVNEVVSRKSPDLEKSAKASADFADPDFYVPIYNVWRRQEKTPDSSHFGNTETQWLQNCKSSRHFSRTNTSNNSQSPLFTVQRAVFRTL